MPIKFQKPFAAKKLESEAAPEAPPSPDHISKSRIGLKDWLFKLRPSSSKKDLEIDIWQWQALSHITGHIGENTEILTHVIGNDQGSQTCAYDTESEQLRRCLVVEGKIKAAHETLQDQGLITIRSVKMAFGKGVKQVSVIFATERLLKTVFNIVEKSKKDWDIEQSEP